MHGYKRVPPLFMDHLELKAFEALKPLHVIGKEVRYGKLGKVTSPDSR